MLWTGVQKDGRGALLNPPQMVRAWLLSRLGGRSLSQGSERSTGPGVHIQAV